MGIKYLKMWRLVTYIESGGIKEYASGVRGQRWLPEFSHLRNKFRLAGNIKTEFRSPGPKA